MLGRIIQAEHAFERRNKIIRHRATDAAIRKLDDAILAAALHVAPFENLSVDADVAELVDDDGKAAPFCALEHVAHEGRLARTEEASHDRAGNFDDAGHATSGSGLTNPKGGILETTPLRNASGRSLHGTMPLLER